jgi:ElaB/YqjD/DUF883 family membrane-anchored ribosome-binding protein
MGKSPAPVHETANALTPYFCDVLRRLHHIAWGCGYIGSIHRHKAYNMKESKQLDALIQDVDQLIATLADDRSPHVQELKRRVQDSVDSLEAQRKSATRRVRHYAASVDRYITGYPRLGFATGVVVGGLIVYMTGLLSPRD